MSEQVSLVAPGIVTFAVAVFAAIGAVHTDAERKMMDAREKAEDGMCDRQSVHDMRAHELWSQQSCVIASDPSPTVMAGKKMVRVRCGDGWVINALVDADRELPIGMAVQVSVVDYAPREGMPHDPVYFVE